MLCKNKRNKKYTTKGNTAVFASLKSRHCSVLPPRPLSLDPKGFKQLERRQLQHSNGIFIVPATGPASKETYESSIVTQPSEDIADGGQVKLEYDRDLSVDQYSFYQPMVRPFNTSTRDAFIVSISTSVCESLPLKFMNKFIGKYI